MQRNVASHFRAHERWEVFSTEIEGARVEMRAGRVQDTDVRNIQGAGVRIIADNKLGAASSTSGDMAATISAARTAARFGRPAAIDFPAPQELPSVENFDGDTARLTTAELAEWLTEAFKTKIAQRHNIAVTAQSESICRHIVNHKGLNATHRSTALTVSIWANIGEGFEVLRETETSCRFDIDLPSLFRRFRKSYRLCSGTVLRPEHARPAMLSEKAVFSLVELLETALVSVFNAPNSTLLHDLRDRPLLRNDVQIVDSGAGDWLPGSSPFDHEGVPRRLLTIVKDGRLKNSIFDLRSARLKNEEPTGNAVRRFDSAPCPQFNNPALLAGDDSEEDMVAEMLDGLYIDQLKNFRFIPGGCCDFRAQIGAGFLIRKGRWAGPVRALDIAGNLFGIFGEDMVGLGAKTRRLLRGSAPAAMLKELYVCG